MAFLQSGIFVRHDAQTTPVPLVVDVSRSGRVYPKEFRSPLPFTVLHDNVSMYVEDLWAAAPQVGATLLYCCFPNTFIDVNRKEDDLDPAVIDGIWPAPLEPSPVAIRGLGLIKTKSRYGEPLQEKKLSVAEIQERFDLYYHPYHRELKRIVDATYAKHGVLWQLSCHCMSAVGAPTHADAGKPRADFCLGNIDGTTSSPEFIDLVAAEIGKLGYSVTLNDPYIGNELNRRYGAPAKGIESIMVEINKKLFMDTTTFRRNAGFDKLKSDLDRLLQTLAGEAAKRAR
ncbi:MAG: N-formylglutamate amidohydrolase [Betaproteobacteria bacterium]|nr:N-formylglutamate amidohydrolase [Betaproteobacteria bacterium]